MPGLGLGTGIGLNPNLIGLHMPNSLHEWYMPNSSVVGSTMTAPDTGSVGGLDLINPTAAQLPSYSTIGGRKSVLSDGVDDILVNNVTNFRGGDTSGVMHFVFKMPSIIGVNLPMFASTDGTSNNQFLFFVNNLNQLRINVFSALGNTTLVGTSALIADEKYVFSVFSTGTTIQGYLGTNLEFSSTGVGGVRWFVDIAGTTTEIEMLARKSPVFIGKSNQAWINYAPYTSVADALADQKNIANHYRITV